MTVQGRDRDGSSVLTVAAVGALSTILMFTPSGASVAQFPPDSLMNLQVLPEGIETRALINTMRGFASGLGVRCPFCHVGEEGQPLSTFDFPSDERPTKRKAREMLRMVQRINTEFLANLDDRSDPPIEVTCGTCHHGQSRPQTLESVLVQAHEAGGLDTAVARYRVLRDRYYGSSTFDFSEPTLRRVAERLEDQGGMDDALVILELNAEMFPASVRAKQNLVLSSLWRRITEQSVEAGIAHYHELKAEFPDPVFAADLLNVLGYRLLGSRRAPEAIAIFQLNVEMFPGDWNVYDSLGEAFMGSGDRARSIRNEACWPRYGERTGGSTAPAAPPICSA